MSSILKVTANFVNSMDHYNVRDKAKEKIEQGHEFLGTKINLDDKTISYVFMLTKKMK
ncbi:hypothetical protein [Petroclostridium sp. X23]|uniref:hypothetical protein n=1 Tax=Petroclostridium sp. X23 TaxID=3045146 RepID=UPI0024AE061C|nr:hypothetical protein [Petroclostridium sp. X23]WHH61348.1 hypothetical protein QKW49_11865 [Petroclostridium sp. X23]